MQPKKSRLAAVDVVKSAAGFFFSMVLETTSRNQGSELSGATMIPKMTVVADLTRSED